MAGFGGKKAPPFGKKKGIASAMAGHYRAGKFGKKSLKKK